MSLRNSGSSIPVLMGQVPVNEDIQTRTLALSDYIERRYPFVDFEIKLDNEETIKTGTLHVLGKIFPDRNFDGCKTSQYTDGITNKLFKIVTSTKDSPPVLVRVYGTNTEMLIDREQEIITMELLSEAGIAQPIYGRFTNGLCYGFAEGKTFSVEEMKCPVKLPLVAKELARFHAVNVLGAAYREPSVFMTILNWVDVATEAEFSSTNLSESRKINAPLSEIMNEYQVLHNDIKPFLAKAKICFCHNDLLCKNILYHTTGEEIKVRFIDYEYGHYNYAAFDIGNHFNEMMGYDVNTDLYPNRETQLSFLTSYVNAFREIKDYDHTMNPNHNLSVEEEVEILYNLSNKFALVSHFFWAIWARVQAVYSDISDFDYYSYSNIRIAAYHKFKDEFLALGK